MRTLLKSSVHASAFYGVGQLVSLNIFAYLKRNNLLNKTDQCERSLIVYFYCLATCPSFVTKNSKNGINTVTMHFGAGKSRISQSLVKNAQILTQLTTCNNTWLRCLQRLSHVYHYNPHLIFLTRADQVHLVPSNEDRN